MFDADDLATRLLNREMTNDRVLKMRRHLARDMWATPQVIDGAKVSKLLDAVEAHPSGGENARAFVHNAIVNAPARTIPPLPADIAAKVEAFHKEQADRKARDVRR